MGHLLLASMVPGMHQVHVFSFRQNIQTTVQQYGQRHHSIRSSVVTAALQVCVIHSDA